MCDEPVGIKRLRAKPHARFCIYCRPIYEKEQKS
ncbi:TraR/DksA C4-type zinc finger protein [Arcobacter sp. F2176]|nr:TraR/DksA C4-type zinc finger protein [Arcobacter sp. F2176]